MFSLFYWWIYVFLSKNILKRGGGVSVAWAVYNFHFHMTDIAPAPTDTLTPPLETASGISTITKEQINDACLKETNYADHYATNQTSSVHAFNEAEKVAFVKHINKTLEEYPELSVAPETNAIFDVVKDGVLLWYFQDHWYPIHM